jgi:hypothetical protein
MMPASHTYITRSAHMLLSLSGACPEMWKWFGRIESQCLRDALPAIDTPIYINGLARSGSTLLLEILAAHPDVATHRYRDFPFIMTPYIWDRAVSYNPLRDKRPRERPHGDGMTITPDSPEALEEMLWMVFFPDAHDAQHPHILEREASHPAFEYYYRTHIQKLLLAQHRLRYASKANYNVTRMTYLQRLFPEARFVIPVRHPVSHIASLIRQHQHFRAIGQKDPRVPIHMSRAGHFEFGLNRIPVHTGDDASYQHIISAWEKGEEIRGWALYWNMVYGYIHRQLEQDLRLRNASLVITLEDLSTRPADSIQSLLAHCRLTDVPAINAQFVPRIHSLPNDTTLHEKNRTMIRDITSETAALYGYTFD